MSQTKAQLIQPIGVVTASGVVVSGVMTAATFDGDIVGSATSIIQGTNLNLGAFNATSFVGDFTGNATGIITSSAIKVGQLTASSFVGDFTGTATSMARGTGFEAGAVTGSSFVANVTGNVTGNATGLAGSVTQGTNIHVGVVTATTLYGDGSTLTGIAATNFNTQTVTANGAATTIDLSAGNMITFNQSANTTVSFANTSTAMSVTLIRVKDSNATARTITWPSSVKWNGGSAPTLITNNTTGDDKQQFHFLTRDSGLTWYAWDSFKLDEVSVEMWAWGNNFDGSMGQNIGGSPGRRSSPVQIPGLWKQMSSGNAGGIISTKADGTLWTWGDNEGGQLGHNSRTHRSSPTQVGSDSTWGDGLGNGQNGFQIAVKTDGTLWSWGYDNTGKLGQNNYGQPNAISSPTQVGTNTNWGTGARNLYGDYSCAAIKTDGTLWTWGTNSNGGQLGLNDKANRSSPTQVGTDTDWSIAGGGGQESMFYIKTDGTLWAAGNNGYGQLAQNNKTVRSSPTQIPGSWKYADAFDNGTIGVKTDGTLWWWGRNVEGCSGQNNGSSTPNSRSSPVQIGTDNDWDECRVAWDSVLASKTDKTLWAWGNNNIGALGLNDQVQRSSPTQIPGTWESLTYVGSIGRTNKLVPRA